MPNGPANTSSPHAAGIARVDRGSALLELRGCAIWSGGVAQQGGATCLPVYLRGETMACGDAVESTAVLRALMVSIFRHKDRSISKSACAR